MEGGAGSVVVRGILVDVDKDHWKPGIFAERESIEDCTSTAVKRPGCVGKQMAFKCMQGVGKCACIGGIRLCIPHYQVLLSGLVHTKCTTVCLRRLGIASIVQAGS